MAQSGHIGCNALAEIKSGWKKIQFSRGLAMSKSCWTKTKTNYRHYAEIKHFWLDFFKSHEYFKPIRVLYFMVVPDVF